MPEPPPVIKIAFWRLFMECLAALSKDDSAGKVEGEKAGAILRVDLRRSGEEIARDFKAT